MTGASSLAYARPGHLLFVRGRTLLALPFDASRLERTGEPQPVAEGVQSIGLAGGAAAFSVSANGVLAYWRGAALATTRLTWFTRDGSQTAAPIPVSSYTRLALAPDGHHVAVEGQNEPGSPGIWLLDLVRGTTMPLTNDAFSIWPIWSPDGTSIIFSSTRGNGRLAPYRQSVTAGGEAQRLLNPTIPTVATDWSTDGQTVVVQTGGPPRGEIWVLALTGGGTPRPFLRATAGQTEGHLSPDGRWMAYVSNESSGQEVYVTGFPGGGGKWPISTHGGTQPRWRGDGKELYYRAAAGTLMAVTIKTEPTFEASAPVALFDASANYYAVTYDGLRFLVALPQSETTSPPITVVLNWTTALKK
jgi:Tol biopolymer transport system component